MSSNLNIAAAPTQDEEVIIANREFIKSLRHRIEIKAGDNSSLLGTTADGVQLLLFAFSNLIVSLNQAQTLAQVREAAAPFNDISTSFLAKLDSGEVVMPFHVKGLDSVIDDIETRATAVAQVLADNG